MPEQTNPNNTPLQKSLYQLVEGLFETCQEKVKKIDPSDAAPPADGVAPPAKKYKHEMEKLLGHLQQIRLAMQHLDDFEKAFTDGLEERKEDINQLFDAIKPDDPDNVVEKRFRELNKQVRKLKHRIPLYKSSGKDKLGHPDKHVPSAEAESSSAKSVEELLNLQTSRQFLDNQVYKDIKAIYDKLEDNQKKCLLCFAALAENEDVKKRMLSYWWRGEGYLSDEQPIKEAADEVLKKLVEKGLVEPVHKKKLKEAKRYRMKNIYRSAVVKLAEENDTFVFDESGNFAAKYPGGSKKMAEKEKKVSADDGSVKEKKGSADGSEKGKKGSADGSEKKSGEVLVHPNWLKTWEKVEKIETIFNANEKFPDLKLARLAKQRDHTATEWLLKMKSIKVLYLGSWRVSTRKHHIEVDNKINILDGLMNMNSLRLFSLQGISGISSLTNSISGLSSLEILDLKSCHNLEEIPQEIRFLRNLTHLDVSNCFLIDHMPRGLSFLTKLQVLKGFVLADYRSQTRKFCNLSDLSGMKCLKKLSIVVGNEEFPTKTDLDALKCLTELRILSIFWGATVKSSSEAPRKSICMEPFNFCLFTWKTHGNGNASAADNSTDIQLPETLEKLDLLCYPKITSPAWLSPERLKKLKRLYIRGGKFKGDLEKGEWGSVESLRLKYLAGIKMSWEGMRNAFPRLTYLEKVDCPMITLCPCDEDGVWVSEDDNAGSRSDYE